MVTAVSDDTKRAHWRARLEAGVQHAWIRRNGWAETPAPFDTGAELLEIDDDIEVYPMWGVRGDDGEIRMWSNHPMVKSPTEGAWQWRDTNPPPAEWFDAHEDEEWLGTPEWSDNEDIEDPRYVYWIVNGPHDQPPPVPDGLIEYLIAVNDAGT